MATTIRAQMLIVDKEVTQNYRKNSHPAAIPKARQTKVTNGQIPVDSPCLLYFMAVFIKKSQMNLRKSIDKASSREYNVLVR